MLSFATTGMIGCDGYNGCAILDFPTAEIYKRSVAKLCVTSSLSQDNQTLSAGVAPNKNNTNVRIFHEYFEYIVSAAHFDVINYFIT
jgi:hypothetical protein